MKRLNVLFMGTPEYSVYTLKKLVEYHNVIGVFCQPDKPVGRKHIITPPPIKEFALSHNISVFQPESLKNGDSEAIIRNLCPDLIVVVAYGKILPESILNIPKYGCINGHASLLPKYRGASPIQSCLLNGDSITGVTVMKMDKGMDTGDMISKCKIDILEDDTAESLFNKLSLVTGDLIIETIDDIVSGKAVYTPQNSDCATACGIITKDMAMLSGSLAPFEALCRIKGFYSWPCAFFTINGKRFKIHKATLGMIHYEDNGVIHIEDNRIYLSFAGGDSLQLLTVQPEGTKVMADNQIICGNHLKNGDRID